MTVDELRDALIQTGHGRFLELWGADADQLLAGTIGRIERFQAEYQRRFGEQPDPLTLLTANPYKAAAFFQPDTLIASPTMQVVIWRILLGCDVEKVDLQYERNGSTTFRIWIQTPYGQTEEYSGEPSDMRILRHFGIVEIANQVVFEGYYAIQRPSQK